MIIHRAPNIDKHELIFSPQEFSGLEESTTTGLESKSGTLVAKHNSFASFPFADVQQYSEQVMVSLVEKNAISGHRALRESRIEVKLQTKMT